MKEKKSGITYADMKKGLKGNAEALKELTARLKQKKTICLLRNGMLNK